MEKYNLTAFSKGAELRVSWYPTERPQGMAEFSEWQSSKVEYKVSDESSIELADLIRNGMKDINPKYLFSRYGMDLQKGIPIQHLEDRIEIPPIKKTEEFVVKLKPLPEEENQENLIEELRLIFQDQRISAHQQKLSIESNYTIIRK